MNLWHSSFFGGLGLAVLSALLLTGYVGCKGDSAPAPTNGHNASARTVLHVLPTTADPMADPLSAPAWRYVHWTTLTPPLNDSHLPPFTRVAALYQNKSLVENGRSVEAGFLYVAFVCAAPELNAANLSSEHDMAEVWLDTSAAQNGTEFFSLSVNPAGQTWRNWYRSSLPPKPKADGSPNLTHPISRMPDYPVPGLLSKVGQGSVNGEKVWTVVLQIPLKGLPLPLRPPQALAKEGARWQVNLLRSYWVGKEGQPRELLQANLAPVHRACQGFSPYRMADLLLEGNGSGVAFKKDN